MASKRLRFKATDGLINSTKKIALRETLFKNGVKISKIIDTKDSLLAICYEEKDVDAALTDNVKLNLTNHNLVPVIPPPLRAKKSVIVRRLDRDVTDNTVDDIAEEIEHGNQWAKVEEIYKFDKIKHMLKIRFTEISMAKKAIDQGFAAFHYFIPPNQIEPEQFIPITPCWTCYGYSHQTKDCPAKETKVCSECASPDHTFRECTNRENPKCVNCGGGHRTLAAQCPVRRDLIKKRGMSRSRGRKMHKHSHRLHRTKPMRL